MTPAYQSDISILSSKRVSPRMAVTRITKYYLMQKENLSTCGNHYPPITIMSFIKKCLLLLVVLCVSAAWSQDDLVSYWQPGIAVNYKVAPGYEHNFSLTKRTFTYRDSQLQFDIRQLDLVHFSNLKILDNQSIGFGIQYRFRKVFEPDRGNELRLTQQYNITFRPRVLRIGHRLRSEQRIFKQQTIHR